MCSCTLKPQQPHIYILTICSLCAWYWYGKNVEFINHKNVEILWQAPKNNGITKHKHAVVLPPKTRNTNPLSSLLSPFAFHTRSHSPFVYWFACVYSTRCCMYEMKCNLIKLQNSYLMRMCDNKMDKQMDGEWKFWLVTNILRKIRNKCGRQFAFYRRAFQFVVAVSIVMMTATTTMTTTTLTTQMMTKNKELTENRKRFSHRIVCIVYSINIWHAL